MLLLTKPTRAQLDAAIASQRDRDFAYAEVGATRDGGRPAGYTIDHNRVALGHGAATYERARVALTRWTMFDFGWSTIHPARAPIVRGTTVAALFHHLGFWSINVSRIVYTLDDTGDETDGVSRFGFAYGTLPEHAEIGEERFSVQWDRRDDRVWYDLYAFSRPGHPLARLGAPLARMLQRRFVRDSKRAMTRAVDPTLPDE